MERSCDHSGHRRRIPPCLLFSDLRRRLPLSAITILDSASKMVAIDLKEKSHDTTFLPSHRHLSLLLLVDGYRLHYEASTVTISKVVQHSNIVFDYVLETEVRPSDVVCAINTDDVMVQDVISEKGFKVVGMHFMVMDAGTRDALEAEKSVDGFNIAQEAGEWKATIFHPYLPSHAYLTCRFFSARKHGLMDELFCDS